MRSSRIWLVCVLSGFAIPSGFRTGANDSAQPPRQAAGYRLVFSDTFQKLDLSPDGGGNHAWYNGVWFREKLAPNSNIENPNGYLSIHWNRGQGCPETSITTLARDLRHHHAWRYGYFETRMKWKPIRGAWPALWLISLQDADRSNVHEGKREAGEIDIFEGQGAEPLNYYATIHDVIDDRDVLNNNSDNRIPLPAGTDVSKWHNYGVLWIPGRLTWYFDDAPIHSEKTYAIFDRQDYYLVLTEQVGVDWNYGDSSGVNAQDLSLDVQWVRVWQH